MFIQNTLEIINAFLERYVPYTNEQGDYTECYDWSESDVQYIKYGNNSRKQAEEKA